MGCRNSSSREYPNSASTAALTRTMLPFSSDTTTAPGTESNSASSISRLCSNGSLLCFGTARWVVIDVPVLICWAGKQILTTCRLKLQKEGEKQLHSECSPA